MNTIQFNSWSPWSLIMIGLFVLITFSACSDDDDPMVPDLPSTSQQVIVTNEGNYGSPNGEISVYNITEKMIANNVFNAANNDDLGDTFQSIYLVGAEYYALLQTSSQVVVLDTSDFTIEGTIDNVSGANYLHTIDDDTAYITTGFGGNKLYKVSLTDLTILSEIDLPGIANQILSSDGLYVIAAETGIYLLDPSQDIFVDTLEVGSNPGDMQMDKNGDIWVSCGGKSWTMPVEPAGLYKINVADRTSEEVLTFPGFGVSARMAINGARDTLFVVNDKVYKMSINNALVTQNIFTPTLGSSIYGLGVDPMTSEVYIADAMDFSQNGSVYRLTADGVEVDVFTVGPLPNGFLFGE